MVMYENFHLTLLFLEYRLSGFLIINSLRSYSAVCDKYVMYGVNVRVFVSNQLNCWTKQYRKAGHLM